MVLKSSLFSLLISFFSKEVTTVFIAALPVFELRLAVPIGILKFNLPIFNVYFLALLGNMLPVIPLLLFLKYFFHRLQNLRFVGSFFKWWFKRVERKSKIIEKWGFWGLVCFVAIPLPVTGAWTGSAAATLLEMKPKKAFLAIFGGVCIAGIIVTILSLVAGEAVSTWISFSQN